MCGEKVFANVSAGADTKANALGAGGALELGDLGLLEDGGELRGSLGSDAVVLETATEGWSEDGQKSGVSAAGADIKASTFGSRAGTHFSFVSCVSLSTLAKALPPSTPSSLFSTL